MTPPALFLAAYFSTSNPSLDCHQTDVLHSWQSPVYPHGRHTRQVDTTLPDRKGDPPLRSCLPTPPPRPPHTFYARSCRLSPKPAVLCRLQKHSTSACRPLFMPFKNKLKILPPWEGFSPHSCLQAPTPFRTLLYTFNAHLTTLFALTIRIIYFCLPQRTLSSWKQRNVSFSSAFSSL